MKLTKLISKNNYLKLYDKVFFVLAFVLAFLFMSHVDIWETSSHSYLFLESLFSGQALDFYSIVEARDNTLYYVGVAFYNIVIYILFGAWQLPVFLFNTIFSLPVNEQFLWLWTKALCVLFFIGCGYMVKRICMELKLDEKTSFIASMFFLFNPVAFFSPVVIGQYDSICLFFALWALVYYIKGDMKKFCIIMGVSVTFKFFTLLILLPLLLLKIKKLFPLIKYTLICFWLYVPATLLYMGKASDAGSFTSMMFDRMFLVGFDSGFTKIPFFVISYCLILFFCFIYTKQENIGYLSIYISLVVFGLLFFSIYWHPQWIILLMPFMIISTFLQENKRPWLYLDLVFCFGFFILIYFQFPAQFSANLFSGGVFSFVTGVTVAQAGQSWKDVAFFLGNIPNIYTLASVAFSAAIFANIILKFPVNSTTISNKISDGKYFDQLNYKLIGYLIFLVGFIGFWVLPSVFEMLNAHAIL